MRSIKKHLSTAITALCGGVLTLLGYGCSSSQEDQPAMYGMPTGDFEIKGSVTTEDGNGIADAEIRVTHDKVSSGVYSLQTTSTDINGQYKANGDSEAASKLKVVCIPSDPTLEADSVVVTMHYNKENAGSWYVGDAEETVNFKLKHKTPEQE